MLSGSSTRASASPTDGTASCSSGALTAGLVLGLGGWRQLLDCAVLLRHVFHGGGGILRAESALCGLVERFLLRSSKVCVKVDGSGGARVEMSVIFSR